MVTNSNADLVLLGAGHSHLQLLAELIKIGKCFQARNNRGRHQTGNQETKADSKIEKILSSRPLIQVLLIDRAATVWYSGFFSGFLYGEISQNQMEVSLPELTATLNLYIEFLGIELTFLQAEALSWNLEERTVVLSQGESITPGALSINLGAPPKSLVLKNQKSLVFKNHEKPSPQVDAKPLAKLIHTLEHLSPCEILVVGGGASGIELVLGIQAYVNRIYPDPGWSFVLVYSKDLLKGWPRKAQTRIRSILSQRGIGLVDQWTNHPGGPQVNESIDHSMDSHVDQRTDQKKDDQVNSQPNTLPGLVVNATGFFQPSPLQVDSNLRVVHCSRVYGSGDGISVGGLPPVYGGVYPVRQGPVLLRSLLEDRVLTIPGINPSNANETSEVKFPWVTSSKCSSGHLSGSQTATKTVQNPSVLQIINLGTKPYGIGRWKGITMTGWLVKKLKYAIDQKFMDQFSR